MRRAGAVAGTALCSLLLATAAANAQAVAETPASGPGHTVQHGDPWIWWKLANFTVLVAFLAWIIVKKGGPWFVARSERITAAIGEAAKFRQDAEERLASVERKIDGLRAEIEELRTNARAGMAAEGERLRDEAERHMRRLQQQAQQEIENLTKGAQRNLRRYSAELALKQAEAQLRGRVDADLENRLVNRFANSLGERREAART